MRWQQFTGPVMAKGLEDTAYYVHNSLISMNEVGGDPLREAPPVDLAAFHRFQAGAAQALALLDERHLHARYQAQRGRAGAHQRALRDSRRMGEMPARAGSG